MTLFTISKRLPANGHHFRLSKFIVSTILKILNFMLLDDVFKILAPDSATIKSTKSTGHTTSFADFRNSQTISVIVPSSIKQN